jgi:RNA polymerase sigma-70 factor, ECF subfamily
MSTTWDVSTKAGFLAWYDASVEAAHRYASQLCGHDVALAEDVVHDVYVSLLSKARSGSIQQASIGLATTSVHHRFIDIVRRDAVAERHLSLKQRSSVETAGDPDSSNDVIAELPQRERIALTLRYIDELSVPEIAKELGISVHATESLLMRAKARARKEVRRHG